MKQLQLCGRKILITRPAHQAEKLAAMVESLNGIAIRFPVLNIEPVKNVEKICQTIGKCKQFDWLIFTSANAVNFTLAANNGKIPDLNGVKVAAIGTATANSLLTEGYKVDLIPETGYNSEALLASPELQDIKHRSILIIKGVGGRTYLAEKLNERGANLQFLEVYKRVKPTTGHDRLNDLLDHPGVDIITITSVEALHNLLDLSGLELTKQLLHTPLVVISNRIKTTAEQIGFVKIAVTASPSDIEIINTVSAIIYGEESGRSE